MLAFTVILYVEAERALEPLVLEVEAPTADQAFEVAVAEAKESGVTSSGYPIDEDDWENATEIATFYGHRLDRPPSERG